jgi:methionyl-tRNA formyltransferase
VRLAFLGTPDAAVPPLEALVAAGHDVAIAVTQPDKRRGRGGGLQGSPVKVAAERLGVPVTERVDDVIELQPPVDLGVVVAFGRIIRPHVLAAVPMVNVHFSLLPRWRGAAPVERAILAGDEEIGVCIMEVAEGLDTGAVYACERVAIGPEETAAELRARLVDVGTRLLVDQLDRGLGTPSAQQGEPTYAAKIEPEELRLDWSQSAVQLHRVVRVGRAWTTFRGQRLHVAAARLAGTGPGPGVIDGLVVGAGDGGGLELVRVKPEGRGEQDAAAWRNGARIQPGERLGQ